MDQTDNTLTHCSHIGCPATVPNHAWGRIKSDWFFQRNGTQYCPDHTPAWVAAWRADRSKTTKKEG